MLGHTLDNFFRRFEFRLLSQLLDLDILMNIDSVNHTIFIAFKIRIQ